MNRGSLAGYSPLGHKESDTTEWLTLSLSESSHTISHVMLKIYPEVLILKEHYTIVSYSHLVSFYFQLLFYFHKFFIRSVWPLIIDSWFLFLSNFTIFYEHFSHAIFSPFSVPSNSKIWSFRRYNCHLSLQLTLTDEVLFSLAVGTFWLWAYACLIMFNLNRSMHWGAYIEDDFFQRVFIQTSVTLSSSLTVPWANLNSTLWPNSRPLY